MVVRDLGVVGGSLRVGEVATVVVRHASRHDELEPIKSNKGSSQSRLEEVC